MTAILSEMFAAQDGILSDSELNHFQVHCFAVPLQPEELAGVKAVVSQKMPEVGGASRGLWTMLSACTPPQPSAGATKICAATLLQEPCRGAAQFGIIGCRLG